MYRVLSSHDSQLYAYKRVEVKGSSEDYEAVFDSYINEIELLKRLKGSSPYIIDLVDAEVNREEMYIAIVMEAGEVDLAKVLSQPERTVVALYYHDSLTMKEIGRVMRISESRVCQIHTKLLQKLKNDLERISEFGIDRFGFAQARRYQQE